MFVLLRAALLLPQERVFIDVAVAVVVVAGNGCPKFCVKFASLLLLLLSVVLQCKGDMPCTLTNYASAPQSAILPRSHVHIDPCQHSSLFAFAFAFESLGSRGHS